MLRCVLTTFAVISLQQSALSEVLDFHANLASEKIDFPTQTDCLYEDLRVFRRTDEVIRTDLGDCGWSVEPLGLAADSLAVTAYGRSRLRVGGFSQPGNGVGASTTLQAAGGKVSASARMVVVRRPRTAESVSLRVFGNGLNHFETASAKVFDHDSNELLLSWFQGGLKESLPYRETLNLEEQLGRAFRFEYEVDGQTLHGEEAFFFATMSVQVPEPSTLALTMYAALILSSRKLGYLKRA